jgi:hypothetical protein
MYVLRYTPYAHWRATLQDAALRHNSNATLLSVSVLVAYSAHSQAVRRCVKRNHTRATPKCCYDSSNYTFESEVHSSAVAASTLLCSSIS